MQEILIREGVYSGSATGYFGSLTREGVKAFQRKYGIVFSGDERTTGYGMAGPRTRQKLEERR
ncbi:MAG: peptidoglycan-binding protein [Parcubacteria group bacterium]|nr:peptidoglycan-binding protein [Parcubacteria group bacterium]